MNIVNTSVISASVFKNDDGSSALLVHLADGQTYRINTSQPDQLRIGMDGLSQAFPELLKLPHGKAAVSVAKGAINGKVVSYHLAESKRLDGNGKPYLNVRLTPNLSAASDEDIEALLGIGSQFGGPSF
jgi:hypothetical protein